MKAIEILRDAAHRPLEAVDGFLPRVDPSRLNIHPGGHPNSPAWLLWHTAREMDAQVAQLAEIEQVWRAHGFRDRFGFTGDLGVGDIGLGQTPEHARAVRVEQSPAGAQLLREYLAAVVDQLDRVLTGLDDDALDRVLDDAQDPPVTVGVRLVSLIDDAAQHVGQAAYIAGMSD